MSSVPKDKLHLLPKCYMVTFRIKREDNGFTYLNGQPCKNCHAAILSSLIKRVWHTDNNGELVLLKIN